MLLRSSVNHSIKLTIDDEIDEDGEVVIEIPAGDVFYLNKSGASILIEHLQKTFGLGK